MKKPFAYLLVLLLLISSVCNQGLFVSAEGIESSEPDTSITIEEAVEDTSEASFTSEEDGAAPTLPVSEDSFDTTSDGKTGEILEDSFSAVPGEADTVVTVPEENQTVTDENASLTDVEEDSVVTDDNVLQPEGEEVISEDTPEVDVVEYAPVSQPAGVYVKAYAAAGILPEDAVMTVTALEEGSAEHSAAEEALAQSDVEYDGFKALDISFYDAAGNVIEPEDGTVQVQIELDASLFPEEVNPESLAVQHLNESTGEIEVQTVAETTVGTVAVEDAAVVAEFSVESFSTFTITWTNGWSGDWKETYFEITVHCVNTNGDEIEAPRSDVSLRDGTEIEFSQYAPTAAGLKFKEARYGTADGQIITSLNAESTTEGSHNDRRYYNVVTFANENTDVDLLKYETTWGRDDTTKKADVYLVYETDVVTPPSPETLRTLSKSKTVVSNGDGTYDLNLTISGAVGSINNPAKMDILLIIDRSGSMNDNGKMTSVKNAINGYTQNGQYVDGLIDIVESNDNIDAQYAVVSFSSNGYIQNADGPAGASKTELSWNSDMNTVKSAVRGISANGGTNYQSGIRLGKTVIGSARSDAQKIVIFLTDGLPTFRLSGEGDRVEEAGNGGSDSSNYNINAAIGEIQGMSCNAFYAVGFGSDFTNTSGNTTVGTAGGNLYQLCANVGKDELASAPSVSKSYAASNADQLYKVFNEIAADATSILCDHVSVTDILSENVKVVLQTDNQPSKLLITITDSDGNNVKEPAASVSLDATENNAAATIKAVYEEGQLKIVFPEFYKLEPGWTYKITTTIEPSETAYEKYRENGLNYSDFADANTGTHSSSDGFYSNNTAMVNYTYNGETREDEYDHPVVQLDPGTLVIEKTIEGLEDAELNTLVNQLEFEVVINEQKSTIALSKFTRDPSVVDEIKYVYKIEGLSPDTSYSVKENNAQMEAYDLIATNSNISGIVARGTTETATFTNSYTPSNRLLTIEKTVTGNMGEKDRAFAFALELVKDGEAYTETIKDSIDKTYTATNGVYTFELKHGESVTFTIPYGCEYEITEETPEDYTMTAEGNLKGTITEDTSVKVQNDRTISTPTGIFRNIFPFIMMLVIAIDAAVIFFVMYMRRRRY